MKENIEKISLKSQLLQRAYRIWYWYVNRADKNGDLLFMNYGYHDKDQDISMDEKNHTDRFSIQLYHHLATSAELKNKDIVEIGCGRGGGLSYIAENFSPATAKGVDLDRQAVEFCNTHYNMVGLGFTQGDAQNLNLENNSCDVVINVESSHRYPNMPAFLGEVKRILRPDGYFLFTDFRHDYAFEDMKNDLDKCGMSIKKGKFINQEVVAALDLDDDRRRDLINKLTPRVLHKTAQNFAGTIGSPTYKQILSRKYLYFSYVLQNK